MDVEEIAKLETLLELHSLACQFEQEELRETLVGKVKGLLTKESRGPCETVELRNLLVKHKVEELLHLVKESQVKAGDLEGLLAIVSKGGSQSKVGFIMYLVLYFLKASTKVAKDMLVRYLGTTCPSTRELAAFAASTSKELLSDKILATILQVHILGTNIMSLLTNGMIDFFLQGIHEVSRGESVVKEADSQTVLSVKKDIFKKVVEETDAKEEEKVDGKDILRRFLVFTKFPEKFLDPMIEKFYEEAM